MTDIWVSLPDGGRRQFAAESSAADVAAALGDSLAKTAVACKVDGELRDINLPLPDNCALQLITRDDDAALELIRHDCAHLLAQAVGQLFNDAQPTIGPAIDNGFYYDFFARRRFWKKIWRQ